MVEKLKNVRPGVLIIPDAGLRLDPGEEADVQSLTPQIEAALSAGYLVKAGSVVKKNSEPKPQEPDEPVEEEDKEEDITKLSPGSSRKTTRTSSRRSWPLKSGAR